MDNASPDQPELMRRLIWAFVVHLQNCLLTESVITVVYVEEQIMPRLDCTDAHTDLDLRCLQIAQGPFSCVAHRMMYAQPRLKSASVPILRVNFKPYFLKKKKKKKWKNDFQMFFENFIQRCLLNSMIVCHSKALQFIKNLNKAI